MDNAEEVLTPQVVAGQFSFSVKLDQSNDKTINFTGFIYAGDDVEACNARVDLIDQVVTRQITRSSIPLMEADLEQRLKNLDGFMNHVYGLQKEREELKNIPISKQSSVQKKQFTESQKVID